MKVGYIGLGKMGLNMTLRLEENGVSVVAWNRSPEPRDEAKRRGIYVVETIGDLVSKLPKPRMVWLMLTAGPAVDEVMKELVEYMRKDDLIIDGGNSFYRDTVQRYGRLREKGIHFVDAGVSGGPKGARNGTSIMVGGDREDFEWAEPIFKVSAVKGGYAYFGRTGAGHFVKMVHNGIEYGMMQAIAEGAAVLKESDYELDVEKAMDIYNHCSVIESRLVGWAKDALEKDPELAEISSVIAHLGEGEWTVKTAKELGVEVPIIEKSLEVRLESEKESENFRNKVVSAMRGEFGGHEVRK